MLKAVGQKNTLGDAAAAASPPAPASASDSDPMSALVPLGDDEYQTPKKRRKVYVSKRAKDQVLEIIMPEKEISTHPLCTRERRVRLLASSTNSLWIAKQDVEWAVLWLAAEYKTGGVALHDNPFDGLAENCSIQGVHMRWSFDNAWEAIVIAPCTEKGNKTKSYVRSLDRAKWDRAAEIHHYAVAYEHASANDRKTATYHFLEIVMRDIMATMQP